MIQAKTKLAKLTKWKHPAEDGEGQARYLRPAPCPAIKDQDGLVSCPAGRDTRARLPGVLLELRMLGFHPGDTGWNPVPLTTPLVGQSIDRWVADPEAEVGVLPRGPSLEVR